MLLIAFDQDHTLILPLHFCTFALAMGCDRGHKEKCAKESTNKTRGTPSKTLKRNLNTYLEEVDDSVDLATWFVENHTHIIEWPPKFDCEWFQTKEDVTNKSKPYNRKRKIAVDVLPEDIFSEDSNSKDSLSFSHSSCDNKRSESLCIKEAEQACEKLDLKCYETQLEVATDRMKVSSMSPLDLVAMKHMAAAVGTRSLKIEVLGILGERFFYRHKEDGTPEPLYTNCANV